MKLCSFVNGLAQILLMIRAFPATFNNVKHAAEIMGFKINESKTKYMKTTANTVPNQVDNTINIVGYNFEVVDELTYLGVLTRPNGDTTPEIKRRIMAATRWYYGLLRHLRSMLLSRKTRGQIYKTLIRPVLTYGCESWTLKKSDEQLLLVFERKVPFGGPNIFAIVKIQPLMLAGHLVARMNENTFCSILFRHNRGGRRGIGRSKLRWIDDTQTDLEFGFRREFSIKPRPTGGCSAGKASKL